MPGERRWTLEAAREIFPDVRKRTRRAVEECAALAEKRDALGPDAAERETLERRIAQVLGRWSREMDALGLEVKGVWLVDFDNGSGYYCWRWPEEQLAYFHGYEDGFDGRTRIQ